jgi:hypothetical protein
MLGFGMFAGCRAVRAQPPCSCGAFRDRWSEDVAAKSLSEVSDLLGWSVFDRVDDLLESSRGEDRQPAAGFPPRRYSANIENLVSNGNPIATGDRQEVLFLVAVTVRRDSATRLGHGFDHRVRTVRVAAVDPDCLALTVGTVEPNIAPPTELGPSTLGDVSILPPALCRSRWGTWLYGARHAAR